MPDFHTISYRNAPSGQYPFDLGFHVPTGRLCRLPRFRALIPSGCVRVRFYRDVPGGFLRNPYDEHGELKMEYWSIPRAQDLDPNTSFRVMYVP